MHALLYREQLRIADALSDRADHGARRSRRSMDVETHLDELCDDGLNLLFGRPLLHDNDHDALIQI